MEVFLRPGLAKNGCHKRRQATIAASKKNRDWLTLKQSVDAWTKRDIEI
jgi:hypothetical protein